MAGRFEEQGYTTEEIAALKQELAVTVRLWGIEGGVPDKVVRMTWAKMFGEEDVAREFGPEPGSDPERTAFVRDMIRFRMDLDRVEERVLFEL